MAKSDFRIPVDYGFVSEERVREIVREEIRACSGVVNPELAARAAEASRRMRDYALAVGIELSNK